MSSTPTVVQNCNTLVRLQGMLLALAWCFTLPTLSASEWPQFRGPTGDGVSPATYAPIHWSATENVAWKTPIPGSGWSSPILSHGRLYLTTAVENAESNAISLRALCVDASDGKILWNIEVMQPSPDAAKKIHTKNSFASPTPIVDGDRLYVHFGHLGTAALDFDGKPLWRQQDLSYDPLHGNGGSPVLVDDLLVFSCDAASDPFIAAIDARTGKVRWRKPRETSASKTFSFSTPSVIQVDGAQQIISAGSGLVGGYDPQDGREIWRVTYGQGFSVVPRPVFAHDLLFVATGYSRPLLLAIDPHGARSDATGGHVVWSHEKGAPLTPSVIVAGDELYIVSDNGIASCLDARSKKVHWNERLPGDFSASPILAAGKLYFQNEAGVVYVVRAATEFEILATNDVQERALASPAVADNSIFLRTADHLWKIGD